MSNQKRNRKCIYKAITLGVALCISTVCLGQQQRVMTEGWTANMGVLFLQRDNAPGYALLADDNGVATHLGSDFDFQSEAGIEFTLQRKLDEWLSQTRYTGMSNWMAAQIGSGDATENLIIASNLSEDVGGIGSLINGTDFKSIEFNFQRLGLTKYGHLGFGFRYLKLDDHYQYRESSGGNQDVLNSIASNQLYGFQLTGHADVYSGDSISVSLDGNAGVYHNEASTELKQYTTGTGTNQLNLESANDDAAFVAELRLALKYHINPRVSIAAGYQVMWIDGIALGTGQMNDAVITDSGSSPMQGFLSPNLGETLRFNGAFVHLVYTW